MAIIDLSALALKVQARTPLDGGVDAAEVTRLAMAISLNRVYTGWGVKSTGLQPDHFYCDEPFDANKTGNYDRCLGYRLACCLACRRPIFVDSPRQPCGNRSYHHCPKEVAA